MGQSITISLRIVTIVYLQKPFLPKLSENVLTRVGLTLITRRIFKPPFVKSPPRGARRARIFSDDDISVQEFHAAK